MKEAGMKLAMVSTGADENHKAAQKAYEKAGYARNIPSINYFQTL